MHTSLVLWLALASANGDGGRRRAAPPGALAAIDAAEREQRYGNESGATLRTLTLNRTVKVEYDKTDRYVAGTVWTARPDCRNSCPLDLDAGLLLVGSGLAWHFKRYAHEQPPDEREPASCRQCGAMGKK